MVGWHHRLDGHEFEQAPGVGDGQGSLVCCTPPGHKESDTTEQLNELLLRNTGCRQGGFCSCGSRALEHRLSSCGAWAELF